MNFWKLRLVRTWPKIIDFGPKSDKTTFKKQKLVFGQWDHPIYWDLGRECPEGRVCSQPGGGDFAYMLVKGGRTNTYIPIPRRGPNPKRSTEHPRISPVCARHTASDRSFLQLEDPLPATEILLNRCALIHRLVTQLSLMRTIITYTIITSKLITHNPKLVE